MCGRYNANTEAEVIEMRKIINEINERYLNRPELAAMKTGEIFPTNVAPILALEKGILRAGLMTWGYPQWQGPGVIINARSETVAEKPMFAKSYETRRCIIPSTGFYEWSHFGGRTKEKFLFRLPDKQMLYMAGLFSRFNDNAGKSYTAFVILTRNANRSMSPIHDRQPVILLDDQREQWLNDPSAAMDILKTPFDIEFDIQVSA